MRSTISFILDGSIVTEDFHALPPTTTVLKYLRQLPTHRGVKEGCAEGDCGACTVVLAEPAPNGLRYKAVDACLLFLPMIHGKQLLTVENLNDQQSVLHPVQQEMVESGGSQCGYCTPGIVMSLFSLYKNKSHPSRSDIDDALTGNLCRCTGYRPIIEAAAKACVHEGIDAFTASEDDVRDMLTSIDASSGRITSGGQTYFQPATLDEALQFKSRHPDALVICGATDVALRVTKKHEVLPLILDISHLEELRYVKHSAAEVEIGAAVPLSEVHPIAAERFPSLNATLNVFGSLQIRNLATLGGNLGTASPIGDLLSSLIPLDAKLILQNATGMREVELASFITGYRTTLRAANELITGVILPSPPPNDIVRWYKVSKRKDLDISTVSAGIRLSLDTGLRVTRCTLAYGGMAERVKQASSAEKFLLGRRWSRETVEQAMPLIDQDFSPISDARAGAEFRRVAARNLLLKFWWETQEMTNGHSPAQR